MPGLVDITKSSSSSSDGFVDTEPRLETSSQAGQHDEYAAASYPGYSEKPLHDQLEPIAVIGMGCRLPGEVKSASDFWDMMVNKRSGQTPKVPSSRFNIDAHYHKNNDRPGSFGVLGGYFLDEDLSNFDPGLFGITPIEAMWMDPQQRKLLEVVYEALESGGITIDAIAGTRTAVFAASFTADWQQMAFKEPSFRHSLAATGVDPGIISNRISHVFNLNGPSIVVNTACSSSVYALHNACNALRNKECEGAIVGGVNLVITVDQHMNTAKLGVLSPTSICHTFDSSADGYGRADAVGAVYLKRLSDAVRDGDPIRGVIRSSATNSNGKVPAVGITHPNREGQADVIAHAYQRGGDLDPRLTGYFECHGTGTAVGDPLEVHAVSIAMNKDRKPHEDPLLIGAVKTNIGHSEAASGLSALIKAILIVERGLIPPVRGLVNPSPRIKWDDWQVKAPTEIVPFPSHLPVRRVSINSFGYGGTNAHIIVEGAESLLQGRHAGSPGYTYSDESQPRRGGKSRLSRRTKHQNRPFLLLFSAHDKATLNRNIDAHAKVAHKYELIDLSHTLASRRSVLASKGFTVASQRTLSDAFTDISRSFNFGEQKRKYSRAGFVFTGQGGQWPRMGAELIRYSQVFRDTIHLLDAVLQELEDGPAWFIEDILLEKAATSPIGDAEYSQPLCTAVQVALVQLLRSWGIHPALTVGHSSGEIAAAYAAGLITARDAITAAYFRGQVTRDVVTEGSMLAVGLGADDISKYLGEEFEGTVVVACHNSPTGVTLSGDADAIEKLRLKLDADKIFARVVKTSGKAYHSHHMAPVAAQYEAYIQAARAAHVEYEDDALQSRDDVVMVSSVTNSVLPQGSHLDEKYWSSNLRNPVLFNQAIQTVLSTPELSDIDVFLEIGPHSVLSGPVKQIKAHLGADTVDYLPTLLRGEDSAVRLLNFAGQLFLRNYPLDMTSVVQAYAPASSPPGLTIVDLPPYQWNYTRPFWAECRTSKEHRQPTHPRHDVLGQLVIGSSLSEPLWRNVLRLRDLPWLRDHSLGGEAVFPAAGYFSMAIEAITQLNELSEKPSIIDNYVLRDVSIKKALVTPDDDDGIEVLLNMRPSVRAGWWDFRVSSVGAGNISKEHMEGSISINKNPRDTKTARSVPDFPQRASRRAWNQALREVGFDYGPTFQDMDDIRFDGQRYESSCKTALKQVVDESLGESRYVLHPATVDSVLQLSIAAIHAGRTQAMTYGVVPIQVDEVTVWPPTQSQLDSRRATGYAWVPKRGLRSFEGSAQITANDDELVLEIVNVRTTSYEAAVPQKEVAHFSDAAGTYGKMAWALDLDALNSSTDLPELHIQDLISLALFKHPGLKTLEIGSEYASGALREYTHAAWTTLVDEAEDETAKKILKGYSSASTLTAQALLDSDGLSAKRPSYDIIVAPSVESIPPIAHQILKSGGYIIVPAPKGTEVQDANLVFRSNEGACVYRSIRATSKTDGRAVHLVYHTTQTRILAQVKDALEKLNWTVHVSSLNAAPRADHVILLADLEAPLLFNLSADEFASIQRIISTASSLLWVTAGGLLSGKHPELALTQGLARSVRSEQASIDFRTLDFDLGNVSVDQAVGSIVRVALLQARSSDEILPTAKEGEIAVSNGKTFVSRLVRNQELNKAFTATLEPTSAKLHPSQRVRGKIQEQGKVVFEHVEEQTLQPNLVEVQVKASGLIREGVVIITGSDYPTTFSHTVAGEVVRVGDNVSSLKPGDSVVGFNADTFSNFQRVPESMLLKVGAEDNLEALVGSLVAYVNALYGLEITARIKPNDIVLVLGGTGTSGLAAIRIAQAHQAIPYVEARTPEEATFLETSFGLDSSQIILDRTKPICAALEGLTKGRAPDVVFSGGTAVDPTTAAAAWRGIARFGRFVDSGRKDVLSRGSLDTLPISRGASYLPFDFLELQEHQPKILADLLPRIVTLLNSTASHYRFATEAVHLANLDAQVSNFSDSFAAPQPVITFGHTDQSVPLLPPGRPKPSFSPENTYLLVGCLGGIGRSLTSWMMQYGARRFTFLSRSAADSPSAAKLVQDIQNAGAIVQVIRGDATSRADVVRTVEAVSKDHPIRGVVHAAMVLRDGLFHSMTYENWRAATAPKVLGVQNLHSALLGESLDFFITTSSVSGTLGTPGQSNYAAANSYLDAISRHRVASAQVSTSIILPMVLGVGVVAENTEIEDALRRKGMYGIDEEKLLEAFEAAIAAPRDIDHVVVGLDPAVLHRSLGEAEGDIFWREDSRFSHLTHAINAAEAGSDSSDGSQSILATIKSAPSPQIAVAAVTTHFIEKLARMLLLEVDHFEPHNSSIASYGIDSMIGAELRNWIFKEYRIDIPFQQLLAETLSIDKFAKQVCEAAGVLLA